MRYYYETFPVAEGRLQIRKGRSGKEVTETIVSMISRSTAPEVDEQEFEEKMREFGVEPIENEVIGSEIMDRMLTSKLGRPAHIRQYCATKEQAALIKLFFGAEGYCPII